MNLLNCNLSIFGLNPSISFSSLKTSYIHFLEFRFILIIRSNLKCNWKMNSQFSSEKGTTLTYISSKLVSSIANVVYQCLNSVTWTCPRRVSVQSLAFSVLAGRGIESSLAPKGHEHPRSAIPMCSCLHGGDQHYLPQVYLSKEWPESSLYTKPKPLSTVCEKGDLCWFTAGLGPSALGLDCLYWAWPRCPMLGSTNSNESCRIIHGNKSNHTH